MAVTGLKERMNSPHKGSVNYVRYNYGTGSPIGDTVLQDDGRFPIGSQYLDKATALLYHKTAAGTWVVAPNIVPFISSTGTPIGNSAYNSNTTYPIGSVVVDSATGIYYTRTATSVWTSDSFSRIGKGVGTPLAAEPFFIADRACILTSIVEIHGTAGTDGSAVTMQITKDTGTTAPGAGTALLTNNTNAGFNMKGTANTLQTGALTATTASITLAAGDRLSYVITGTKTAIALVQISAIVTDL